MKSFALTAGIVCVAIITGMVIYLDRQKVAPPMVEPTVKPVATTPANVAAMAESRRPEVATTDTNTSVPTVAITPLTPEAKPDDANDSIHKMVDALLHARSAKEKHELFQALLKSGQMDQAIADLKQRAIDNPNDPEIPTTMGEALLNKLRDLHDSGQGDYNDIGILAMQADQSFNAALKIDPSNWEAQFVKASSMYYWPADPARDNDVVQRLSNLIDQQETMTTQPQFAQTYVVLGNEYQKIGQTDKALATWQLGLQKYPSDTALQGKVNGQ